MNSAHPTFAADLIDSAASLAASEAAQRAVSAVETASQCAFLLSLAPEALRCLSGSTLAEATRQAEEDAWATAKALGEAARLVAAADPLGDLDDEDPARTALVEARAVYHAAVAELGIDPLSLAA